MKFIGSLLLIHNSFFVYHGFLMPYAKASNAECEIPSIDANKMPDGINEAFDIPYKDSKKSRHTLDIAWPQTKGPHPLVVMIHGGGWTAGHKNLFRNDIRRLARLGYTAAAINYRLAHTPRTRFPAAILDSACALRWLHEHAQTYAINSNYVAILGASAGGHIAAMLGLSPDFVRDDTTCKSIIPFRPVQAAVAYYAPLDLSVEESIWPRRMNQTIQDFLGTSPTLDFQLAKDASPMFYIRKEQPPFLLLHGAKDTIVPISQSRNFAQKLQAHGNVVTLIEDAEAAHGFAVFGAKPKRRHTSCATLQFLKQHLKN